LTEVHVYWTGRISEFMHDDTPEIDLEGALSCGKTTACLTKVWRSLRKYPGIHWWIGRFGDGDTQTKIRPAFEAICQQRGGVPTWDAKELAYHFPNQSKCYCYGLKSPDAMSRYSKIRGMGVAGIYLDQTEELPEDFSLELRARLRQPGFPHQLIFSPNPPNVTHWLAQQFPTDNRIPGRKYYAISVHDNAHNLPIELVDSLLRAYPPEHAKHRSVILGQRGVNVSGVPVYKGHFVRQAHIGTVRYDPQAPLLLAIDFGKHHPCAVVCQQPYSGGLHVLGGILGQDVFLDDFLPIVKQQLVQWFPTIAGVQVCCDPAGSHQNSQGTRFNGVDILRRFGYEPSWRMNANAPDVRAGTIEAIAAHMRRRTAQGAEAFMVEADPDRWIRVSLDGPVVEPFLVDALEAGYVWDEHMVSVGNKQIRKPKKDGWFEHGMNCLEYLELTYGADKQTKEQEEAEKKRRPVMPPVTMPTHWSAM
jgi:PBSX family phage terminase large subunit